MRLSRGDGLSSSPDATEHHDLNIDILKLYIDFINLCGLYVLVQMARDWQTLTKLTGGCWMHIERVRLAEPDVSDIVIEGRFELPPLARLSAEDQIFVAAFVRCHGSIKQMEQFFGVSYPTIKNRLNRIGALLPGAEIDPAPLLARPSTSDLLSQLERGDLTVDDVLRQLHQPEDER